MGNRGRQSSASLAVVSPVQTVQRPDAPYDLTDEQADEWRALVDRMPGDWFPRETWPLLSQYCRHIVAARRVAQLINQAEQADQLDIGSYDKLLAMQEREGRAVSSLATRMRLTQQTTYDKSKKKPSGQVKKPWEG